MNWNGVRALVTGGAGFVPSHIVDLLVERGAEVTVLDNLKDGKLENLNKSMPHVRFIEGDVRNADAAQEAASGQDYVFHLAANANVPNSLKDPRYDFETNALGSFNIFQAAKDSGVRRVVYASSAAVYGEPQYVPMDEKHPLNPCSFYGCSKLFGEREGFMFADMFDMEFVAIRIFNTYGPRQPRYVMADLLRKLRNNPSELEVLGDGTQVRDYSYVADTARAFIMAAEIGEMSGQAYNIAGGNPISIRELVSLMLDTLGLKDTRVYYTGQSWKGDITRLVANIEKVKAVGFKPEVPLANGIHNMVEWFQSLEY
ncbi:MAG: NAD-dependent epimerase/dehydratase family protein [Armatimonadota bacterium]